MIMGADIEHENEMLTIAEHLAHVYIDVLGERVPPELVSLIARLRRATRR